MAVITKGTTFANGDQVTAAKLNNLADNATFASGAVDNVSTQLSGGAVIVKDGGISTAKLSDSAVTTAKIANSNVTKAKIENVANMKVLGNTSGSATAPQEVSILDEDDMSSDSATSLATQQSTKAYIDTQGFPPSAPTGTTMATSGSVTLPGGLIMKFGTFQSTDDSEETFTFPSAFPNNIFTITMTRNGDNISSVIGASSFSTTGFTVNRDNALDGTQDVNFIAMGN